MRGALTLLCLALAGSAYAQGQKPLTPEQKQQQQRINECRAKAGSKQGDARKLFMKTCLAEASAAQKQQQERMSACTRQANAKRLSGEARRSFISSCLKGKG